MTRPSRSESEEDDHGHAPRSNRAYARIFEEYPELIGVPLDTVLSLARTDRGLANLVVQFVATFYDEHPQFADDDGWTERVARAQTQS